MPHSISLITSIAAGLGLPLIVSFIAVNLRLLALIGSLVFEIIIGPAPSHARCTRGTRQCPSCC